VVFNPFFVVLQYFLKTWGREDAEEAQRDTDFYRWIGYFKNNGRKSGVDGDAGVSVGTGVGAGERGYHSSSTPRSSFGP
jgi:hypothetical protein